MENKILHGDSLDLLKDMDDNSVDSVVTDPPYGYSFMGKDWDKALPPIEIWKECVRVLKPGAFAFVMSAPRSDVHSRMCLMLEEAGFRIDFTPIAWTYATGFPKASNIGKMVDKRLGKEREVIGIKKRGDVEESKKRGTTFTQADANKNNKDIFGYGEEEITSGPASDKAKELDGSYGGFQPKPAWENVIVCMKPITEKTYVDQAMKNGKGITWLDGARIPLANQSDLETYENDKKGFSERSSIPEGEVYSDAYDNPSQQWGFKKPKKSDYDKYVEKQKSFKGAKTIGEVNEGGNTFLGGDMKQLDPSETYLKPGKGRFPANLLVQDDILNNGTTSKSVRRSPKNNKDNPDQMLYTPDKAIYSDKNTHNDEGSFSRYYDLDAWWEERIKELPLNVQATYPFIIVPKASKAEKNKGCGGMEEKFKAEALKGKSGTPHGRWDKVKNNHPTVKPISLMSYLITLGSREDELVLDPFVGSGTTCIAAKLLNRKYIGMEMDSDYVVIAQKRIKAHEPERQQHDFF